MTLFAAVLLAALAGCSLGVFAPTDTGDTEPADTDSEVETEDPAPACVTVTIGCSDDAGCPEGETCHGIDTGNCYSSTCTECEDDDEEWCTDDCQPGSCG